MRHAKFAGPPRCDSLRGFSARQNYFELQVSPRGVHFDTRYDSARQPRPFGHVDWDSRVEAKVQLNGTLNDDKADKGYVVELAIPWQAFATGATPAPPPAAGATWRMNFSVMAAQKNGQRAAGWSPPLIGDFHTLAKFGRDVSGRSASFDTGCASDALARRVLSPRASRA